MKRIKIVQVGIGHDHAISTFRSMLKQSDVFDVAGVVVCEGEEERWTEKVAGNYSAATRITLEEALAIEDLDAVAVECDDWNLTKYSMIFATRGVHIHMDKPGGTDRDSYEQMLSLMKKKGLVFQTGYMYRYNPVVQQTLTDARAGTFGEVYAVETHMDCIHTAEKRAWLSAFPGGMMHYLGCHLIDLIMLFKGVPDEVMALNMPTGFDGVSACDYGMAILKYSDGISFAKTCAAEPGGFMRRQIVVCGRKMTREIKPIEAYVEDGDIETPYVTRSAEGGWNGKFPEEKSDRFDRYDTMMRHFAECVAGERENPYTYEYEARLHRVVLAACGVDSDYKGEIIL